MPAINRQTFSLPGDLSAAVERTLDDWKTLEKVRRIWAHDSSIWTGADESNWLGWLNIVDEQLKDDERFGLLGEQVQREGFRHLLLLGMGGSSLCPEVMRKTFGKINGFPELHVLDSTDPAQIKSCEEKIDLAKTLFIVSSKSGSTLEPNIFKQYFFDRVRQVIGSEQAGGRFIAITDPGSKMQQVAEHDNFRQIYFGLKSIGGRYSALSDFGMIPAAAMGVDVSKFLERAAAMEQACRASKDNPGLTLGVLLGTLARAGRDKLTIVASPAIRDLGAWLEQLVAESTGKNGRAII